MKKIEIIKKNYEFESIISNSKSIKNKYFSIFYKESISNKYGISIPKKTGNAVIRNKIKRQIKGIIDNNKISIPKNYDYVIIIRKGLLELDYLSIEKELMNLLNKIKGESDE